MKLRRSSFSRYYAFGGTDMPSGTKEKLEDLTRIFADPTYFLKYVKIQEPGQLALEYKLWPHLIEFFQALEDYRLNILIKSKQVGISWALASRVLRELMTVPGCNILELSSGEKEAQKLLAKTKIIFNNLPEWLREVPDYEIGANSTEQFGFKGMRSLVTALPSTEKAGIGETSGWVIHDEADFHDYFEINLGHTLSTVSDSPTRKLTIVTTLDSSKPDSIVREMFKAAQAGLNDFHPIFYNRYARPDRNEAWFEGIQRELEATPWLIKQNYPLTVEEALSPQSAQSCFKKEVLDNLWDNVIEPIETRQGFIHILHPPRVGTQYVGGVDVGEGVGLDYSCLTIVGKYGLQAEVVAVIYSNKVGTAEFAYDVAQLCNEYRNPLVNVDNKEYQNLLLNVDNIGIGRAVIDKLLELGYTNLFYGDKERKKAGWSLTRPNKRELVVKLVESINDGSLITRFKPQIKELMEYQWVRDYPEPTGKTHGDTVISLMLANQMLPNVGIKREMHAYIKGRRIG